MSTSSSPVVITILFSVILYFTAIVIFRHRLVIPHDDVPTSDTVIGPTPTALQTVENTDSAKDVQYRMSGISEKINCNSATSHLVAAPNGRHSCVPKWPDLFGGPDGSDIMFCGGSVRDLLTGRIYTNRLPPSDEMPEVASEPRFETVSILDGDDNVVETKFRWMCASPGSTDHMMNPYVEAPFDRLKRIRNTCAKYIYRAVPLITFSKGHEGFCDCLAGHGKIHIDADKWLNKEVGKKERSDPQEIGNGLVSMPHTCSPCKIGGGLDSGSYTVNIARGCIKSFDRLSTTSIDKSYLDRELDRFPCGVRGFNDHSKACSVAVAYVGVGLSEFGRRVVGHETLL
jgi:hypothetical protein